MNKNRSSFKLRDGTCGVEMGAWIVFLERGFTRVILTPSKHGEFKELLISRDLMEIELNGVHFLRLCFFELFATEIGFFDQIFFSRG